MSAKSEAALAFKLAVTRGGRCTLHAPKSGCDGPLDAHHLIKKQRIRVHVSTLEEPERLRAMYDPRIGIPVCRRHHHELEHGFKPMFYEDLPQAAIEYARDWGLEWSLDRDFPSLEELRGVV